MFVCGSMLIATVDVLPATRDYSRALCDGDAWLAGAAPAIPTVSLCPPGMTALSMAPPPDKIKRPTSAFFLAKAAEEGGAKKYVLLSCARALVRVCICVCVLTRA